MIVHNIEVRGRAVSPSDDDLLMVQGGVNADCLSVSFDEEWGAMESIVLFFSNGPVQREAPYAGSEVSVPWEVLERPGYLFVTVRGYVGQDVRLVTKAMARPFRVACMGAGDPMAPGERSPDLVGYLCDVVKRTADGEDARDAAFADAQESREAAFDAAQEERAEAFERAWQDTADAFAQAQAARTEAFLESENARDEAFARSQEERAGEFADALEKHEQAVGDAVSRANEAAEAAESVPTFVPSVSADGVITWTNDKGAENPPPANVRGPKGDTGDKGQSVVVVRSSVELEQPYVDVIAASIGREIGPYSGTADGELRVGDVAIVTFENLSKGSVGMIFGEVTLASPQGGSTYAVSIMLAGVVDKGDKGDPGDTSAADELAGRAAASADAASRSAADAASAAGWWSVCDGALNITYCEEE